MMKNDRNGTAALVAGLVIVGVVAAGCSPRTGETDPAGDVALPSASVVETESASEGDVAAQLESLEAQQLEIAQREAEIEAREAELARREIEEANRARVAPRSQPKVATRPAAPVVAQPVEPVVESVPVEASPVEYAEETPVEAAPTAPVRQAVEVTVPAGTPLDVEFESSLSSATSTVGERFRGRVATGVTIDGETVIPAGSVVLGSVTEVVPQRKIGGQARLALGFDAIELPSGETVAIQASFADAGHKQTRKDAATIGGSAAGGAILGRVVDRKNKDKATAIGAIVGAAVGTAVAANNAGDDVEIPAGTVLALRLDEAVRLTVER